MGWWLARSVRVPDIAAQFTRLPQATAVTFRGLGGPDLLQQLRVPNGICGATPQLLG